MARMRDAGRWAVGLCVLLVSGATAFAQSPEGKTVSDVIPRGNRATAAEQVINAIQTRKDRPYKQTTVNEDVTALYKTHLFAHVTPYYQLTADDKVIVYFDVQEFPSAVQEIRYEGAKHLKDDELNTITGLRRGVPLNPEANKAARQAILRRYHEMGRIYADVQLIEGGKPGDARVVFRISEGREVKVKSVQFVGGHFVGAERLRQQTNTSRAFLGQVGGTYNPAMVDFDEIRLKEYYNTYGYQDVQVRCERIPVGEDGMQLVFHIDEGPRYRVKRVQINGNKEFSDDRVRAVTALKDGALYDRDVINADLKNIRTLYGNTGRLVIPREQVFQTGPAEVEVQYEIQERPPAIVGNVIIIGNDVTRDNVIRRQIPLYPGQVLTYPDMAVAEANLARLNIFETDPEKGARPTVTVLDPDSDNPCKDILVRVQETATGSLLLGVGVNSDAGLSGSIVLNERNFDIARPPLSIDELLSGRAFRGAGQELRLEAVPGTQFQRYTASFREPSLFDSPYSLGTSAYYYTRAYTEYSEQRTGGRINVGRRFGTYWNANMAMRIEDVQVNDVPFWFPPDITQAVGSNFLVGLRPSIGFDTRDSYLRPTQGMQFEAGYEQVFGDFTYPLFTVEASKYWTVHQRPDGSGRHVLAARSQVAFAGDDTPVYDRFYAGGFRSMRGFEFRGVGPFELGLNVGGQFMWLNSLEYQIPVIASDKFYFVGFVDSGTVERKVEINNYRVAAGVGMRIVVPMLGPVPVALDFGFPIVKGPEDRRQMFSFWLGFFN